MCTRIHKGQQEKIAREDLVVFKFLILITKDGKDVLVTPYRGMVVELGKTYVSKLKVEADGITINHGFHTFKKYWYAHYVTQISETTKIYPAGIAKCVVPKGAIYFEDVDGMEIVSNSIKYVEFKLL